MKSWEMSAGEEMRRKMVQAVEPGGGWVQGMGREEGLPWGMWWGGWNDGREEEMQEGGRDRHVMDGWRQNGQGRLKLYHAACLLFCGGGGGGDDNSAMLKVVEWPALKSRLQAPLARSSMETPNASTQGSTRDKTTDKYSLPYNPGNVFSTVQTTYSWSTSVTSSLRLG